MNNDYVFKSHYLRIFSSCCVILMVLFSGCSWVAPATGTMPSSSPDQLRQVRFFQKVGSMAVGQTASALAPETNTPVKVTVVDDYFSAAGVRCRHARLSKDAGASTSLTLCQNLEGLWSPAPSITPQTKQ